MTRPKFLDLYGCEGGSWKGLTDAGWDVYCIDIFEYVTEDGNRAGHSQKRYPGPSFKGDAILALVRLLSGEKLPFTHKDGRVELLGLVDFQAAGASPPCQHASAGTRALRKSKAKSYPALIEPTRWLLDQTGLPYFIENVGGSALLDPIVLCGCMFNLTTLDDDGLPLRLERPRYFESNVPLSVPRACYHDPNVWVAGSYGGSRRQGATPAERRYNAKYVRHGGYVPSAAVQQRLLGIDWMTQKGMHQSLPPVYTQHIGDQMMALVAESVAA